MNDNFINEIWAELREFSNEEMNSVFVRVFGTMQTLYENDSTRDFADCFFKTVKKCMSYVKKEVK